MTWSQGFPLGANKIRRFVCQVLPRRCHDGTRVHLVRAPVRGGEGLSAPFGGWSRGTARAASAKTEDAKPGPGRVDAGPTRPPQLPQGGRAGAALPRYTFPASRARSPGSRASSSASSVPPASSPSFSSTARCAFAPSHRPGQLLGGAHPAVADPAGSCVSACGELPCTVFRGSAIFPSMSPARPAAPRRACARVFRRSAAPRACVDLGARLRRRRDGMRRRVGGCEVPFL